MSRLALITGGHRGIGLGIARALASEGFALALASDVAPDHPDVRAALAALGPAARYHALDVADIACHGAALDAIEAAQGPITTLVSNAGVPAMARGDLLEMTAESFDRCIDVNLRGGFFLAQDVARRILSRPADTYRALVFVTSVSAVMASLERAEYCISKAGASMMARAFALRLAPHGIGVFELRPGIVDTPMTAGVREAYTARIEGGLVPAGRWGTPEDMGRAVVPLVTGGLAFATGSAIAVDGALSIPAL